MAATAAATAAAATAAAAEAEAAAEAAEVGEVAEVAEMVDAQLLEFRRLRQREVVERQRLSDEEDARLEALWQANEEACDLIDQELEAQARLDTTLHYTTLHDSTHTPSMVDRTHAPGHDRSHRGRTRRPRRVRGPSIPT